MRSVLEDAERKQILVALKQANWVVAGPKGAAALLGMKRSTLGIYQFNQAVGAVVLILSPLSALLVVRYIREPAAVAARVKRVTDPFRAFIKIFLADRVGMILLLWPLATWFMDRRRASDARAVAAPAGAAVVDRDR